MVGIDEFEESKDAQIEDKIKKRNLRYTKKDNQNHMKTVTGKKMRTLIKRERR